MDLYKLSKTLSHLLRHAPAQYGVVLDNEGWAPVEEVLQALRRQFPGVAAGALAQLAAPSDKQRFEMAEDRIRATCLYHGTARRFLDSIFRDGLKPGNRQYVHLAETVERAATVGARRDDEPAILRVNAGGAFRAGLTFCRAADQTWLVAHMPPEFLSVEGESACWTNIDKDKA